MRLGRCLAFTCVLLAISSAASGAEPTTAELETARKLFADAESAETAERWEQALATLLKVAAIKETPGVRFHIGNCLEHLGRLVEALESFQKSRSLAEAKKAKEVLALAGPRIEQLKARIPSVRLVVTQGASQPVVRIDHKVIEPALLAAPIPLDPGVHLIEAHFGPGSVVSRELALLEARVETVALAEPRPAPVRPAASVVPAADPAPAPAAARSGVPAGAWVLMGTGAALAVGGAFAFQHAASVADDSRDACARSVACDPDRASAVRRYDGLALGLWSAAAVSLGAGVVWAVWPRSTGAAANVAIAPGRVVLQGEF